MLEYMTDEEMKRSIADQIDVNLRRVYQEDLAKKVPDKFKELLDKLRAKERKE